MNQLRFAFRLLLKSPGSSVIAICTLALGIGLVTTQLSFIKAVMFKGLPFEGADRICHVQRVNPAHQHGRATPVKDFLAWKEQQTSFETLAAYSSADLNLSGDGRTPRLYSGAVLTANSLEALRVKPMLGRGFLAADDEPGAPQVVLLSSSVWKRDFEAREDVVGLAVRLNGEPATIIGVMPEVFRFPLREELWACLQPRAQEQERASYPTVEVFGRLKDGVRARHADSEFSVIASRLAQKWPENEQYPRAQVTPYVRHHYDADGTPVMIAMLAMAAGVLFIGCTNVATMLLAQAAGRTRELAVRAALGATRGRLVTQMLVESSMLAICGGIGGILLAYWGASLIGLAMDQSAMPFWCEVSVDYQVLFGAALVTLLTGLLCGLLPSLRLSQTDLQNALKDEGTAASSLRLGRFNRLLIPAQVAASCALLVLTLLMAQTVANAKQARLAFNTDGLLSAKLSLFGSRFPTKQSWVLFFDELTQKLQALPGVEGATTTSRNPVSMGFWIQPELRDHSNEARRGAPGVMLEVIGDDYFQFIRAPLLRGRHFSSADTFESELVAIVNASFAERHWPNESPLGKQLKTFVSDRWATVVGVAPNLGMSGAHQPVDAAGIYFCQRQLGWGSLAVMVRTKGDAQFFANELSRTVWESAPDLPVQSVRTLDADLADQAQGAQFIAKIFVIFGAMAIFLAVVGVYGVMSFAVAQRTREFGVRFALGAQRADVLLLLMGQSMRHLLTGLAAGLLLALGLSRLLNVLLYNVSPSDPLVYSLVAVVIALVTMLAAFVPARRAGNVDPVKALKYE
jgi:putative ABC transport system permease protein